MPDPDPVLPWEVAARAIDKAWGAVDRVELRLARMMEWIGPYRLLRRLGVSGRTSVYAAEDARLGRVVALRTLHRQRSDLLERERLLREARMAASVSHPGICQVYEVGEADGQLYFAMELLEGESLEARLVRQGPLPAREAVTIVLGLLSALDVLHRSGLVHRALRPSSIFLTRHGQKLLDFALARPPDLDDGHWDRLDVEPSTGEFEYMAPEQLSGAACDCRTDLWAAGALLYVLLTASPPFSGSFEEVREAVRGDQPAPLAGFDGVEFLDRVIARAMAADARDRYQTAAAMSDDLQAALEAIESSGAARASRMTRLIVLPFRMLRPDTDIAFLAFSLADAIATSLSAAGSLIVRSSLAAKAPVEEAIDPRAIADQHEVDVAVAGTLLRLDASVRVGIQLIEVPSGTVVWTQAREVPYDRLFELQDELAYGIADSLSLPLAAREHRLLRHDVPATPSAYEHYLKANQLAHDSARWVEAAALYDACLREDPQYAPAWARLGRTLRVLAKYGLVDDPELTFLKGDAAFKRALELNPDLPIAHSLYAALEADTGRVEHALTRLLTRASARRGDSSLRTGLVQVCRFCGLLDASAAAHVQARRIDPRVQTSVLHTWWALGEYGRVLDGRESGTDPIKGLTLATLERTAEAIEVLAAEEGRFINRMMRTFARMVRLTLQGRVPEARALADEIDGRLIQDPESSFYVARTRARMGDDERALAGLEGAVHRGYACTRALATDPWLDRLRQRPEFPRLLDAAAARQRRAAALFRAQGGEALLGIALGD